MFSVEDQRSGKFFPVATPVEFAPRNWGQLESAQVMPSLVKSNTLTKIKLKEYLLSIMNS